MNWLKLEEAENGTKQELSISFVLMPACVTPQSSVIHYMMHTKVLESFSCPSLGSKRENRSLLAFEMQTSLDRK